MEVTVGDSHKSETQVRVPYLIGTPHYTQHPPPEAARANGQVGMGGRAGRWKRHAGSLVLLKDTKWPKSLAVYIASRDHPRAKSSSTLRHSYLLHTQTSTFVSHVPTHVLSDTCPLSTEWYYFWLYCSNPVMLTPFYFVNLGTLAGVGRGWGHLQSNPAHLSPRDKQYMEPPGGPQAQKPWERR